MFYHYYGYSIFVRDDDVAVNYELLSADDAILKGYEGEWKAKPDAGQIKKISKEEAAGTYNLLLLGVDRREDDWYGNADAIILVTVNYDVQKIFLTSFMRDLYAEIPDYGVRKLNAAHAIGGGPLIVETLENTYGVTIDNYARVDFHSMTDIIDALGGVDMIKDDHGLMDQSFSGFKDRVKAVCEAVKRGNEESGNHTVYVPNLSGSTVSIMDRIRYAQECGAGGIMLAPGLVGYDMMQYAAAHTELPVIAHPAMAGCLLDKGGGGFDCGCVLGQLPRLCGADFTVFPNFGGRFSLTQEQCRSIVNSCEETCGDMPAIFPCPAGGMTFDKLDTMKAFYGRNVALLMGGGLFTVTPDLVSNCRTFVKRLAE